MQGSTLSCPPVPAPAFFLSKLERLCPAPFFTETVIYFHLFELLGAEVGEYVALGGGEDLEGDGAVVVLQGGHVVVPG